MPGTSANEQTAVDLDRVHLADSAFWRAAPEFRHAVFAELRRSAPVRYYPPITTEFSRSCTGFWALTRYVDVWNASRNSSTYRSGVTIDIEEMPEELGEFYPSMINMDDPQHSRLRRLVSAGFTPKQVAKLDAALTDHANEIIDDVLDRFGDGSEFDFVGEVAARLPLQAICDMIGVPADEHHLIFDWTNAVVSPDDPAVGVEASARALAELAEYSLRLANDRRAHPRDDLASVLMDATVDGERLSTKDFANFFILLVSAGNETTRNAISHGMRLLTQFPDQRRIWFDDFAMYAWNAAEEIVRYETPISNMCRVLTEDVVIQGVPLAAGEKVAMWYPSANRDGDVFANPDAFDVTRPTTPQQVGYGGGGPHFCLGANLARREIVVMFDAIRRRTPELQITGEPERVLSMGLNAIKRLPATL